MAYIYPTIQQRRGPATPLNFSQAGRGGSGLLLQAMNLPDAQRKRMLKQITNLYAGGAGGGVQPGVAGSGQAAMPSPAGGYPAPMDFRSPTFTPGIDPSTQRWMQQQWQARQPRLGMAPAFNQLQQRGMGIRRQGRLRAGTPIAGAVGATPVQPLTRPSLGAPIMTDRPPTIPRFAMAQRY